MMPYLSHPRWARRSLYMLRALLHLAALTMGVWAVWLTPQTVSARLPAFITDVWGVLAVVGAVACLYGALTRRYRWELTGLPLEVGAVVIYAVTVWDITTEAPTRLAQASAVTALALALLIRYVDLLVIRQRLIREHRGAA